MRIFVVALGFLCAFLGLGFAAEPPITRYTLDNGLEVVLAPDGRVGKVVTNLSYRVGALNEPRGRSGFAHLFEHLMFSGTDTWPGLFTAMEAIGANANAWTWEDKTLYYLEGVSATLPMLLSVEADRLANLARSVDQRELDLQRSVVKNEMRQNVIDQPGATGWEQAWTAVFPKGHPYSKTVLGSLADLDAASLDDVRGFFNTYYVPNNAILVIVGDFDVDDAKALVADTFGRVPRGAGVPRPVPAASEPTRVRIETEDKVPGADVGLVFSGPAFAAKENGALAIAAELLGNQEYGVLRQRLVATGLATGAYAGWEPGYLGGRFYLEATAAAGVDAATVEKELRDALAAFAAMPLDPADVERARRTILQAIRVAREPLKDRAEAIAQMTDMLGQPELAFTDDPRIAGATTADVEAAIRDILRLDDASTLVIKPGQRGGYPALFTESTGEGDAFTAQPRPVVAIPKLALRAPETASAPKAETAALRNGMRLVHYTLPGAPLAFVAAVAPGGWSSAPAGKEGLFDLAAGMASRGAGARAYADFARAAKDIGATVGASAGYMATMVTLAVPPDALDGGVALFADAVRRPRFDAPEWQVMTAETRDWLARREADLPDVAYRQGKGVLFPAAAGEPFFDWSFEALDAISLDDARAAFHRLFVPAGLSFISVGPQPAAEVVASLDKAFGDWIDPAAAVPAIGRKPTAFPNRRRILLVPEPGASQTAIMVARAAPGFEEAGHVESDAVMRLLGDDFTSRLNSVIREEKGYSYGVYGHLLDSQPRGSALIIETTVERDNTGPALAEFFAGFKSLVEHPVEQGELDRTVTAYQRAMASLAETSGGLFSAVVSLAGESRTLDEVFGRMEAIAALTLDPVRAQAAKVASLDRALIVLAGDPDAILPQLKAIGIADVEVVERSEEATRALDLAGEQTDYSPGPREGSTRRVHDCGEGRNCDPETRTY
ncbi:zinc protease [Rhizobiaceae bacterium]|nr:zinc protease [Rhizobiaceae bacterium]